jgi:hypothetical protein
VPVPLIAEPPFGVTVKELPAVVIVWSSDFENVTVTVVPFAATVAEDIVGTTVSTMNERVELHALVAAAESIARARQW